MSQQELTTPEGAPTPADQLPLPAPVAEEPLGMGAVLRIAPLRRLWYAQIVSVFGDFVALFAVLDIMTFNLHSTPQQITGVQIAYMAPIAVLGIISGVFVDRWPLKLTMVSSDLTRACLCLILLRVHSIWGYYVALALISVVSSVFSPAQGVAVRSAVPRSGQRAAQALMQQVMFVMRVLGGPLAVVLLALISAKGCFLIDTFSFVASSLFIASTALKLSAEDTGAETKQTPTTSQSSGISKVIADMREGVAFILHHAALLFVLLAMAAAMFVMGCFAPLIAVYVRDILHASAKTFGAASGMISLGLMIGINLLTAVAKKTKNTTLIYGGLSGMAVGTLLLGGFAHTWSALLSLLLIGFAVGGIIVPAQTMIALETPPSMMGRVGSTVMSLIFTAQILGLVLSGLLANHISVRQVFMLCGAMLVSLSLAGKLLMKPAVPASHAIA